MRPELREVSVTDIEEAIRREKEEAEALKANIIAQEMDPVTFTHQPLVQLPESTNEKEETERENPTIFEEDEKT